MSNGGARDFFNSRCYSCVSYCCKVKFYFQHWRRPPVITLLIFNFPPPERCPVSAVVKHLLLNASRVRFLAWAYVALLGGQHTRKVGFSGPSGFPHTLGQQSRVISVPTRVLRISCENLLCNRCKINMFVGQSTGVDAAGSAQAKNRVYINNFNGQK